MDWMEETRAKLKKKNLVLFSQQNPLIRQIQQEADTHNHRTLALWAFAFAGETVALLQKRYPGEKRPKKALDLSKAWAAGEVKMPTAKRAILEVHAFAKEISSPEDIAHCHAVGQACGVVHTPGHTVGYPVYDLTALVRRHGIESCRVAVEQRAEDYITQMRHWQAHCGDACYTWAAFMLKD